MTGMWLEYRRVLRANIYKIRAHVEKTIKRPIVKEARRQLKHFSQFSPLWIQRNYANNENAMSILCAFATGIGIQLVSYPRFSCNVVITCTEYIGDFINVVENCVDAITHETVKYRRISSGYYEIRCRMSRVYICTRAALFSKSLINPI